MRTWKWQTLGWNRWVQRPLGPPLKWIRKKKFSPQDGIVPTEAQMFDASGVDTSTMSVETPPVVETELRKVGWWRENSISSSFGSRIYIFFLFCYIYFLFALVWCTESLEYASNQPFIFFLLSFSPLLGIVCCVMLFEAALWEVSLHPLKRFYTFEDGELHPRRYQCLVVFISLIIIIIYLYFWFCMHGLKIAWASP